jgi:hypothetical protein
MHRELSGNSYKLLIRHAHPQAAMVSKIPKKNVTAVLVNASRLKFGYERKKSAMGVISTLV